MDLAISQITKDTLKKDKQIIIFVNSKRSAEAVAERLLKLKEALPQNTFLNDESNAVLNALSSPTKQCKRLAKLVKRGIAFHHSGLNYKQREIIEEGFKKRQIKIIAATPTLAAGVDLPAFRVLIRDLKRYSGFGMSYIPVLEYEQQAGRAGRPSFDDKGEAIIIASSEKEKEEVVEKYVYGEPESIYSKLAVEPVLRTYVLSLAATGYYKNFEGLMNFMSKTFYAHQYKDLNKLEGIIGRIITNLEYWEFLEKKSSSQDFVSANNLDQNIIVTRLGHRVSQLYVDPYTANELVQKMKDIKTSFDVLKMISECLEMRPLLKMRKKEEQLINQKYFEEVEKPEFSFDEDFNHVLKTTIVLNEWMNEAHEDYLYSELNVTPGDINYKKEIGDWLIYTCIELAKIKGYTAQIKLLEKTRKRLQLGIKEELLPLIKIKGIGRIRARKLFNNKIRDLGELRKTDINILANLLGPKMAQNIKKQLGQEIKPVKKSKRKGQINLEDF